MRISAEQRQQNETRIRAAIFRSQEEASRPARRKAIHQAGETAKLYHQKAAERDALRATGSLIPVKARERREMIARGAGIDRSGLPYAAELIEVAGGEERWGRRRRKSSATSGCGFWYQNRSGTRSLGSSTNTTCARSLSTASSPPRPLTNPVPRRERSLTSSPWT